MDASEQKFFEALAGATSEADKDYEVELSKANTGAATAAHTRTAKPKMIEPEETEMAWDESEPAGQLTVDVYQTPTEIVVESAIAGVRPDDIDVQVTSDSIAIRGSRRREKEVHDEDYLYQECYWGKFARSIVLPQEVDPESATVAFKNSILTVRMPKANRKKMKKLKVRID